MEINIMEKFYLEFCHSNEEAFKSLLSISNEQDVKDFITDNDLNHQNCKRLKLVEYLMDRFTIKSEKEALEFALTRTQDRLNSIEHLSSNFLDTQVQI